MRTLTYILFVLMPFVGFAEINIGITSNPSIPNKAFISFTATTAYPATGVNNRWNTVLFTIQYPVALGANLVSSVIANTGLDISIDGPATINGAFYNQTFSSTSNNVALTFTLGQSIQVAEIIFSSPISSTETISLLNLTSNPTSVNHVIFDEEFNVFSPISASVVLPIKLSSFSAVKDGDRSARLDWTSISEVNSAYFGIERSTDGINWQAIDRVASAGNSSSNLDYQYYDRNLPISRSNDQVFYYRLQLVDIDGKYKYSDVRGVNFKGISSTDVISLYPNPTTSMVNIDLREMDINHGTIDLKVVDMTGRYVINKTINGNGIEAVDVSRFDAGTYQVMVTQGSKQHQKRFIKVN